LASPGKRTAVKRRPCQDVAPGLLCGLGDPDAGPYGDVGLLLRRPELERRFIEWPAVLVAANGEGLAGAARDPTKQAKLVRAGPLPHLVDRMARLERADQDSLGRADGRAHEVEAPVDAARPGDTGV